MNKQKLREKRSRLRIDAQCRKHEGIIALKENNRETARVNRLVNQAHAKAESDLFVNSVLGLINHVANKDKSESIVKDDE